MKAYELIAINRSLLECMERYGLCVGDANHIQMIDEYMAMCSEGMKKTYIIRVLSDRYDIPERTIYRIIDRLMRNIKAS